MNINSSIRQKTSDATRLKGLGAKWCPWCNKTVSHWANHMRWHHRDKIKGAKEDKAAKDRRAYQRQWYAEHRAKQNGAHKPPSADPVYRRAYYHQHKNGRVETGMSADAILDALAKLQKLVVGLQAAGVLS